MNYSTFQEDITEKMAINSITAMQKDYYLTVN
jgi:hypothetical protein